MGKEVRGRIAPTPTGYLHLGHAHTFRQAWQRARRAGGKVVLRMEDLDGHRCRPEFDSAILEDLRWAGLDWDEGPDVGGPLGPYRQSERTSRYLDAWRKLLELEYIYPCRRSRRDLATATLAPHGEEAVFPPEWRPPVGTGKGELQPGDWNWRFRVPDGRVISFCDGKQGWFQAEAGRDFGDFPVWRRDGVPAYELAVVVDDIEMKISEVVRGSDLLLSTCRQLLLYEALGSAPPGFFHADLVRDTEGNRLAKRAGGLSLHDLKSMGVQARDLPKLANSPLLWQEFLKKPKKSPPTS
jgi:glutamyl-tRNA synthetase